MQAYAYQGPEKWHAVVGQILASLGYGRNRDLKELGVTVSVSEAQGHAFIQAIFQKEGQTRSFTAGLHPEKIRAALKNCLFDWQQRFLGLPPSPWGTLMGVRPTKLVHHFFAQGLTEEKAIARLENAYQVTPLLAEKLVRMARLQQPYVTGREKKVAVYVGIPYCPSHCLYCSFPSRLINREKEERLQAFLQGLLTDIRDLGDLCRRYDLTATSLYVGGGTPTCLPSAILQPLLQALRQAFPEAKEWTVEAGRPDTASPEILALLAANGVNRISVNPQTMQQRLLDALGRLHTVEEIYQMYENCKKAGFAVINMDFIAGLPGQTWADMQENMEIVCKLHPENVTIHTLALKKRAPLFHHPLQKEIPTAAETGRMVRLCQEKLEAHGYLPYYLYRQKYMAASFANVGYALPGTLSAYNIEMMEERQSVLAAGPGGATKFLCPDGHTLKKVYMPKDIEPYLAALPEKIAQRRSLCAHIYGG